MWHPFLLPSYFCWQWTLWFLILLTDLQFSWTFIFLELWQYMYSVKKNDLTDFETFPNTSLTRNSKSKYLCQKNSKEDVTNCQQTAQIQLISFVSKHLLWQSQEYHISLYIRSCSNRCAPMITDYMYITTEQCPICYFRRKPQQLCSFSCQHN